MHNGLLTHFTPLRRALSAHISDAAFANIHGSTDSEHIAALYLSHLTAHSPSPSAFEKEYSLEAMIAALKATIRTILTLQRAVLGQEGMRPNSLNLCTTDGTKLLACRFRNHATSQPPTLYYSTRAGVTLNRKYPDVPSGAYVRGVSDVGRPEAEHGRHVIVASEPSTYRDEDWEFIPKNSMLAVDGEGGTRVEGLVEFEGAEWEAKDWNIQRRLLFRGDDVVCTYYAFLRLRTSRSFNIHRQVQLDSKKPSARTQSHTLPSHSASHSPPQPFPPTRTAQKLKTYNLHFPHDFPIPPSLSLASASRVRP